MGSPDFVTGINYKRCIWPYRQSLQDQQLPILSPLGSSLYGPVNGGQGFTVWNEFWRSNFIHHIPISVYNFNNFNTIYYDTVSFEVELYQYIEAASTKASGWGRCSFTIASWLATRGPRGMVCQLLIHEAMTWILWQWWFGCLNFIPENSVYE